MLMSSWWERQKVTYLQDLVVAVGKNVEIYVIKE
jgi:hypothetical protein